MEVSNLVLRLKRQIENRRASTFFVNSPPKAGKSILLEQLAKEIPEMISHTQIIGPLAAGQVKKFNSNITNILLENAYLKEVPPDDISSELLSSWRWLKNNLIASSYEVFVILIDLDYKNIENLDVWRVWFSSIRSLEQSWDRGPVRLLVLLSGYWNPNLIEEYYGEIGLSFPYTISQNYLVWNGVSIDQMEEIFNENFPQKGFDSTLVKLLLEISGGHPGVAKEILSHASKSGITVASLIDAAKCVAKEGKVSNLLLEIWVKLPERALDLVGKMLQYTQIPTTYALDYLDCLHSAGLIKIQAIDGKQFIQIRSWFVELVLRYHHRILGVTNEHIAKIDIENLMPSLTILNLEAYRLIHEIENLTRNICVAFLSNEIGKGGSILEGRVWREDFVTNRSEDIQDRAIDWRNRSADENMPTSLNPIIAYTSMRDLSGLVSEMGKLLQSKTWDQIAKAIEDVAGIRNAVMHNQMIDESVIDNLYCLRSNIYDAMIPNSD